MLIKVKQDNSCAFYNLDNITCIEAIGDKNHNPVLWISFVDGKRICLRHHAALDFFSQMEKSYSNQN